MFKEKSFSVRFFLSRKTKAKYPKYEWGEKWGPIG